MMAQSMQKYPSSILPYMYFSVGMFHYAVKKRNPMQHILYNNIILVILFPNSVSTNLNNAKYTLIL